MVLNNDSLFYAINNISHPITPIYDRCGVYTDDTGITYTNNIDNNCQCNNNNFDRSLGIDLELTQDCNYACKYCIERGYFEPKIMKMHVIDEVIHKSDYLMSKKSDHYCDNITFGYWGGEPTLNKEAINHLTRYYIDNPMISFSIFTNSRLLSEYYDLINEVNHTSTEYFTHRFRVQISYDGYLIHNLNRIDRSGRETGKEVRDNIIATAKQNIPFHLKSTIAYKNLPHMYESYLDICDIYDECSSISNFATIDYTPTLDYSIKTYDHFTENSVDILLDIFEEQLLKIANHEYKRYKENKKPVFTWFSDLNTLDKKGRSKCCAGNRYKCVNYNGDILVCHGCLFSPCKNDHYITSIFNSNKELLKAFKYTDKLFDMEHCFNENSKESIECKNCDADICYCCNAIKYEISKKISYISRWWDTANQPFLCKFYKKASRILAALKIKCHLTKNDDN